MYNNGACIGALTLLLGLPNAYLHFYVTYSLIIHIFIDFAGKTIEYSTTLYYHI